MVTDWDRGIFKLWPSIFSEYGLVGWSCHPAYPNQKFSTKEAIIYGIWVYLNSLLAIRSSHIGCLHHFLVLSLYDSIFILKDLKVHDLFLRNDPCGRRWKIEIVHHMVHCISSNRTNNIYICFILLMWFLRTGEAMYIYICISSTQLISSIASFIPSDCFQFASAWFPEENRLLDAWPHDHEFRLMNC